MWVADLPDGAEVTGLAFAPDGNTLYTGTDAGGLIAWNRATQRPREVFRPPRATRGVSAVRHLHPRPDGRSVLVPSAQRVEVVDGRAGGRAGPAWTFTNGEGPEALAGGVLVTANKGYGALRVRAAYDLTTREVVPLPAELGRLGDLRYAAGSPDMRLMLVVAAGGPGGADAAAVWDPAAGGVWPLPLDRSRHHFWGWNVADGGYLYQLRRSSTHLTLYGPAAAGLDRTVDLPGYAVAVAVHPDGRTAATVNGRETVTLWELTTGRAAAEFRWPDCGLDRLAFAPDGLTCAAAGGNRFVVWDLE